MGSNRSVCDKVVPAAEKFKGERKILQKPSAKQPATGRFPAPDTLKKPPFAGKEVRFAE
jgi:hypothetical protein